MNSRRCAVIVSVAALLGACGGSDGGEVVDSVVPAPTTTIDLADGAFIHNENGVVDGDGGSATTQPTLAGDEATSTTLAPGSDDGSATTNPGDGATSTDGAAGGSTTGGTTTGGAGTASAAVSGPLQGLLVISGVSYPFETAVCEITNDYAQVGGRGIASDGAPFEAEIYFEVADVDDDGTPDRTIDIWANVENASGSGAGPAFSATNLNVAGDGSGGDLVFEIVGQRITGAGNIVDLNGVAFPVDQPGPFSFDARCA